MVTVEEYKTMLAKEKPSKYRNVKTEYNGIVFDSAKEARYYQELLLREQAGEIRDIELQHQFRLDVEGAHIATYKADFAYIEVATGERVVVDVKGMKTPVYRLKKKLVKAIYGVDIIEV